jgi:hypothetical protein
MKLILARALMISVGIWWLTAPPRAGDSALAQWVVVDVFRSGADCTRALDKVKADPALAKRTRATECLSSEDPRIVRTGQVEILTPPGS